MCVPKTWRIAGKMLLCHSMKKSLYGEISAVEDENWWYRTRIHIVLDILKKRLGTRKDGIKSLDIGCGVGGVMMHLQKAGFKEVHGVDYYQEAITICKEKGLVNVVQGDASHLPFPDNSFDVVTMLDVLEHIDDDRGVLRGIRRVLKKNGTAIIFVPTFKFLWGITDEVSHHKRRYTLRELNEKAAAEGLTIIRKSYFNSLLFFPILIHRQIAKRFGLQISSELNTPSILNPIFYVLFRFESMLLRFMDFPFGVSAMIVCEKN